MTCRDAKYREGFPGELTPQEPNDELVSELFQRIESEWERVASHAEKSRWKQI